MDGACLQTHPDGVVLRTRVIPNARATRLVGGVVHRLNLRLQAPPVEGKANQALKKWVAMAFGIRPSRVRILRGLRGREKDLLLEGVTAAVADQVLRGLLAEGGHKSASRGKKSP
jgi:uncharacterized protein (TIGR00251 family)